MGAMRREYDVRDAVCLAGIALIACAGPQGPLDPEESPTGTDTAYTWDLPPGFPVPIVPADNPMTAEKVALGRHLFYDPRLSGNGTQRCASCHLQRVAFADGQITPFGSTGEPGKRNSPSAANAAYLGTLTWASDELFHLEDQIPLPMFGESPVEMGLTEREHIAWDHLALDPVYQALLAGVYPDEPPLFDRDRVVGALASFVRSLISAESPYDRYLAGDTAAMSDAAARGLELFESERLQCAACHGGFLLTASTMFVGLDTAPLAFHNTGLYNVDGDGSYPPTDLGLYDVTGDPEDMGRFRPPSLRNVAVTAPYLHDGSAATLDEVLDHYARGGRLVAEGEHAGDGALNPYKSELVSGFSLTEAERADLLAFLDALTDEVLLTDERFSDPWDWRP